MSQQIIKPAQVVDISLCRDCALYKNVIVFSLCVHEQSKYTAGGVVGDSFHTCQHMRQDGGKCGRSGQLWVKQKGV